MSGFTGRPHSTLTDYFMCCRQWRRCSRQRTMIPSAPTHTSSPSNWHYFLTNRRKVNVTTTLSLFCFFPPLYSPSPPFPLSPPWTLLTSSLFPAVQSLQAMSACSAEEEEDSLGLISLAAQMAFEVSSSPQSRLEGVPFALSWLLLSFCVYSEATETWPCLLWRS